MSDLLIWMAILPSAMLIYRVLRLDKVEEEPPLLLVKVFLLGCGACVPAAIAEAVGDALLEGLAPNLIVYNLCLYLLLVPLAEEGFKYLALRSVRKNPAFNYTFDGIVYGVMASLGFATLENLLYVVGLSDIGVAFARAFLSVPLHCVCGVFMGYYYGMAHRHKALGNLGQANTNRLLALVVPVLVHGIYDFSLALDDLGVLASGFVFTLAMFALAIRRVRLSSVQDEAFWGGFDPAPVATPAQQQAPGQWQPLPQEWQERPAQPLQDKGQKLY